MTAPERIWLDPLCQSDADYHIDRCWHSERPEDCDECGTAPDEFLSRPETDRLIAGTVSAERERCVAILSARKAGYEAKRDHQDTDFDTHLTLIHTIEAHEWAIAAIRGQS